VLGAIGLSFFLILVPVGLAVLGQRGWDPWALGAGAVVALLLVVAIGWPNGRDYVKERYQASTAPRDFPVGTKAALAWFNREDPHDSRIAVVGGRPGFKQYIFYGDDLSNHVQYVAKHGPRGAYLPIASEAAQESQRPGAPVQGRTFVPQCQEWIDALNHGDYDYAVIGPDQRTQSLPPIESTWTAAAGGRKLEERDDVSVFEIGGQLNPAACSPAARIGTISPQPARQ
jgi:hypothetical protein